MKLYHFPFNFILRCALDIAAHIRKKFASLLVSVHVLSKIKWKMVSGKFLFGFLGVGIFAVSTNICFADPAPAATSTTIPTPTTTPTTTTEVITYNPEIPEGTPVQGSCFATSVAFPRADVWRCFVGSEIHDPCFGTAEKDKLVCDVNPFTKEKGFVLQLTHPLPQPEKIVAGVPKVWMLVLEDNSVCTPYTGSVPLVEKGKEKIGLQYGCLDDAGKKSGILYNSLQTGTLWKAQQVFYAKNVKDKKSRDVINPVSTQVIDIKDVNVKTVWQ